MKKQAYTLIGALVFATMFAVSTATAQSANQLVANIPFEFSAGNQKLPAGKYSVSVISSSDQKVLRLRQLDGRNSIVVQMHAVEGKAQDGGRMVFHRYGDSYFLAQTFAAADSIGLEAAKSRSEKAIERELASSSRKMETVALSTRR
jgi:hypothetical protein